MKVAIITPYYTEPTEILKRCHASVIAQTYKNVTHIMVADGNPHPWCDKEAQVEHYILPKTHGDAGATPRALGAMSAFSLGYDAVAFLDADNWFEPNHIQVMIDTMTEDKAEAIVATRTIHSLDGKPMYVDDIESTGRTFVDTNCWFLHKKTAMLLAFWITEPANHLISDKIFFQAVRQSNVPVGRSLTPTVAYVTRWAWHYQKAGMPIPPEAIWMSQDQHGNHTTIKEKDRGVNS